MKKYPESNLEISVLKSRNDMSKPTLEELLTNIQNDLATKNKQLQLDLEDSSSWVNLMLYPETTAVQITKNNNRIIALLEECLELQTQTISLTSK